MTAQARDRVARIKRGTRRGAASLLSARGLRGTAVEFAWLTTHVAMYPLGLAEERAREEVLRHNLEGLPPVQRGLFIGDVEAAGTPIILLHGVVDNRTIFTLLRRGLRRRGFGRVVALNYSPLSQDIRRWPTALRRWSKKCAGRPATSGSTSSAIPWAAWSGATTSSGWAATNGCTPWSPWAPPTVAPLPPACVPIPVSRQMRPDSGSSRGARRTGPRLPDPVPVDLVGPRRR